MKGSLPDRRTGFSSWKALFLVFTLIAAAAVPFYFGNHSSAQTPTTMGTLYTAVLSGPPIGDVVPRGGGRYFTDNTSNRGFETEVGSINLPPGTNLGVFVDGTPAGVIRLSMYQNGRLHLSTVMGQTVPTVNNGSLLEVKHNGNAILSGTFGIPATPTPWPSMSPYPTPSAAFFAGMSGPTLNGVMPRGFAAYAEWDATRRKLGVFVDRVHLPAGTHLTAVVNDAAVGEIVLNSYGAGGIRLDTVNGDTVPTVIAGTPVSVKNGASIILSGTFQVRGFPSPSPTPDHTPYMNRLFGGRLNGGQVVPPVTTAARGGVFIALNDTETRIRVDLGFFGLSSVQTTAKIYGPAMAGETAPAIFDLGTIGGTAGRFPVHTFDVTDEQKAQLRSGLWYVQIASVDHPDGEIRGQIRPHTRPSGFTGNNVDDIAVFRPSTGTWYVQDGSGYSAEVLGGVGDTPVSADFDGDGKTDSATFSSGTWTISRTSDRRQGQVRFGLSGDMPVRGDYDGDGIVDLAVFRPSTGVWYVQKSSDSTYIILQFGMNGDRPVPSDVDGDGLTDITVFRENTGTWYWLLGKNGAFGALQFGSPGDVPIAGDFDGDGADDISVWRPATGVWYVYRSTGGYDIRQFGLSSDIPAAGNYDGDGISDIAVFRPSTGVWYIWRSSDNTFDYRFFGVEGDIPATRN